MNSCLNFTGITSPFGATAFLLELILGWDLLVWLFVAVPWPAPLTIILCWKCFGSVPTVRKMRARFCTAQLPAPEDRSVTLGLVLIFWPLSRVLRYWPLVGRKGTRFGDAIGMVDRVEAAALINQW